MCIRDSRDTVNEQTQSFNFCTLSWERNVLAVNDYQLSRERPLMDSIERMCSHNGSFLLSLCNYRHHHQICAMKGCVITQKGPPEAARLTNPSSQWLLTLLSDESRDFALKCLSRHFNVLVTFGSRFWPDDVKISPFRFATYSLKRISSDSKSKQIISTYKYYQFCKTSDENRSSITVLRYEK